MVGVVGLVVRVELAEIESLAACVSHLPCLPTVWATTR